jgi:hypothetical protein
LKLGEQQQNNKRKAITMNEKEMNVALKGLLKIIKFNQSDKTDKEKISNFVKVIDKNYDILRILGGVLDQREKQKLILIPAINAIPVLKAKLESETMKIINNSITSFLNQLQKEGVKKITIKENPPHPENEEIEEPDEEDIEDLFEEALEDDTDWFD